MWIYDYKSEKDNPYRQQPFVEITHMCYIDNLPLWTYPWHEHQQEYEIAFIVSGCGHLIINDQSFPVRAGSITSVLPGIKHRFDADSDPGMQYYTLRFMDMPEDGELQMFFKGLGTAVTYGVNYLPHIQNTLRLLFNIHHANGGIADGTLQTICLGLLQLTRTLFTNETLLLRISSKYSVSDILNYIQDNRTRKITLEGLSQQFNISASHLSRVFNLAYHISPINYLIHSRITYATEYLLKSDLTITEIAEQVGYDNPTHFTNLFTKRIGCTPSEYREKNRRIPLEDIPPHKSTELPH